ncbi:hypothetical protein K505DRAFT_322742 [Melanomma pulvis-pyrius CBS 109.77]|uniref:F-box domain-containing protein n=1 Tax=Melanomma pulvis-pyrius CBS 109.77 TaxID=1314802 RepID=A0A6A6XKX6_9PLEO|nr:hypothetical protein K505DRAFT_322742 [Melanomma pulvis-pyrius CBS 109.77]
MAIPLILTVPDEILLAILFRIQGLPRDKTKDLISLSIVCKRFRQVALDQLLLNPSVQLWNVPGLVRMYFKHPRLAAKVRALEIKTPIEALRLGQPIEAEDLAEAGYFFAAPKLDAGLIRSCNLFIERFDITTENKHQWVEHLQKDRDYVYAFQALLVVMLPNLKNVFLGFNALSNYPILGSVSFGPNGPSCSEHPQHLLRWKPWTYNYLKDISSIIMAKLCWLELPYASSSCAGHQTTEPDFDFTRHTSLTQLSICASLLSDLNGAVKPPTRMLPTTLEVLTITSSPVDQLATFLELLVSTPKNLFPALGRVELYCAWGFPDHNLQQRSPLQYRKKMAVYNCALKGSKVGIHVIQRHTPNAYYAHVRNRMSTEYTDVELRVFESRGFFGGLCRLSDSQNVVQ